MLRTWACCLPDYRAANRRRSDGWEVLRPNNPGYTYDGVTNGMLGPGSPFRYDNPCRAAGSPCSTSWHACEWP